jgi:hypothetical protein
MVIILSAGNYRFFSLLIFMTLMYPTQPYTHMQKSSDASSLIQLFYHCVVWRSGALQNLHEVLVKEYEAAVKIQVFWMWCWTWTAWPKRLRHYDPSNRQEPLIQWQSIRSHKTGIFSNTVVPASNLRTAMLTSSLQQWDVLWVALLCWTTDWFISWGAIVRFYLLCFGLFLLASENSVNYASWYSGHSVL